MLKKNALKRILTSTIALLILLLIYIFPNNNIDIPTEVSYEENQTIPIYALDSNNYVARTEIILQDKDTIPYLIEALTIDSQKQIFIPTGFHPLIPKGTKLLNYSLNEGILKLNFSKEFLNIKEHEEKKMLSALIYTLCDLKDVNNIMIFIENEKLTNLPNSNELLPITLNKDYGINTIYNITDYKQTIQTTTYFANKYNDTLYYIPITKISNDNKEKIEIIIDELKSSPIYETNLISYLNAAYELKDYEIMENSINISFNNNLLLGINNNEEIEIVKYTLALSLKDTYQVDNINVVIN